MCVYSFHLIRSENSEKYINPPFIIAKRKEKNLSTIVTELL